MCILCVYFFWVKCKYGGSSEEDEDLMDEDLVSIVSSSSKKGV